MTGRYLLEHLMEMEPEQLEFKVVLTNNKDWPTFAKEIHIGETTNKILLIGNYPSVNPCLQPNHP